MSRIPTFLAGAAAGAVAAHFLDPDRGRARRGAVAGATTSAARSGGTRRSRRPATRPARRRGRRARSRPATRLEDPDDVTLARKVETEIFRAPDAPKGDVSVDVQGGIAHLRGEVDDDEWADRLAAEARNVDGIKGVENLLHEPGTPAPEAEPRGLVQERAAE